MVSEEVFAKEIGTESREKKKDVFPLFFFFFQTKNALEQITGDDVGGKV